MSDLLERLDDFGKYYRDVGVADTAKMAAAEIRRLQVALARAHRGLPQFVNKGDDQ